MINMQDQNKNDIDELSKGMGIAADTFRLHREYMFIIKQRGEFTHNLARFNLIMICINTFTLLFMLLKK